jgi:hypothetical protein
MIMERVSSKPKTRRAAGKPAAAAKARARKGPAARRRKTPRPEPVPPPSPDVPYWIPRGSGWNTLAETTRQAVNQILAPAYRQLVLEAQGEVERSVGITLVHLMWLEICGQVPMAMAVVEPLLAAIQADDPDVLVNRHLHLVAAKCQAAELLSKVRMVGEIVRRSAVATPPYLPAPEPYPVITVPAQPAPRAKAIPWPPAPEEGGAEEEGNGKSQKC